jgi:hypothetical protein
MNKISLWLVSCVLMLFGVLLLNKGLDLWSLGANVDGDGIGVHFLGFEIDDRVPEKNIPSYAIGFFTTSVLTIIISIVFMGINLKIKNKVI